MPVVTHLEALEILDGRGRPTLRATCILDGGARGVAAVSPTTEGRELRDRDPRRHRGLGCRKAVAAIEGEVRAALVNKRFADQATLDRALTMVDGGGRLGAGTLLVVSLAFARAHAAVRGLPLYQHFADILGYAPDRIPRPAVGLLAPPTHAGARAGLRGVDLASTGGTADECLEIATDVVEAARARLTVGGRFPSTTDTGALAPLTDEREGATAASLLTVAAAAIEAAGRSPGQQVRLVADVGANDLHDSGWYRLDGASLTTAELVETIADLVQAFPIVSVVEGVADGDLEGAARLHQRLEGRAKVESGDLAAPRAARHTPALEKARAESRMADVLLLRPGCRRTLSETAELVRTARQAGSTLVVGAQEGETEDEWLTDLAVGWGAQQLRAGGLHRSERVAKWNRLLAIERATRWPLAPFPG